MIRRCDTDSTACRFASLSKAAADRWMKRERHLRTPLTPALHRGAVCRNPGNRQRPLTAGALAAAREYQGKHLRRTVYSFQRENRSRPAMSESFGIHRVAGAHRRNCSDSSALPCLLLSMANSILRAESRRQQPDSHHEKPDPSQLSTGTRRASILKARGWPIQSRRDRRPGCAGPGNEPVRHRIHEG